MKTYSQFLDESKESEPIVAYHGTKGDFDEFKTPAWFTPNRAMAHGFAGYLGDGDLNEHSKVYTVHLKMKNPLKTDDWGVTEGKAHDPKWVAKQVAKGHDGVHFEHEGETEYIAFHPHQIKIIGKEKAQDLNFKEDYNTEGKQFLLDLGCSPEVADALLHGGWPDVKSPDHKEAGKDPEKHPKKYQHFVQEIQDIKEEIVPEPASEGFLSPLVVGELSRHDNWIIRARAARHFNLLAEDADLIIRNPYEKDYVRVAAMENLKRRGIVLDENKEEFIAHYGDSEAIHDAITSGEEPQIRAAMKRNPNFSREHHERMLNSKHGYIRGIAMYSPHLKAEDIFHVVRNNAKSGLSLGVINDAIHHPLAKVEDLKYVIDNFQHAGLRANAITKVHKRGEWKPHELEHLWLHEKEPSVRMAAMQALHTFDPAIKNLYEPFKSKSFNLNEGRRDNFLSRHGTETDIKDSFANRKNLDRTEKYTAIHSTMNNPLFTRAHHEALMGHEDAIMRMYAIQSPHVTHEDLHKLARDGDWYVRMDALTKLELAKKQSNLKEETDRICSKCGGTEKSHYGEIRPKHTFEPEIPTIFASIGRKSTESVKTLPKFISYLWGNKHVWVPTQHIIADAKETNEGLNRMDEALLEDIEKVWTPMEMTEHLALSKGVHDAYPEAGINHYPFQDEHGKVSMDHLAAIASYNHHSKPINDFLHRNLHGQTRGWDEDFHENVGHMDAMFRHSTKAPLNVVSGLKQSPQDVIDMARAAGHDVSDHIHIHLPAYTSTSTRMGTALAFTKRYEGTAHVFHIHIPEGHKAIGMENHPDLENAHESELILPRDTILRVKTAPVSYKQPGGHVHVWMAHVVGTNSTPLKKV